MIHTIGIKLEATGAEAVKAQLGELSAAIQAFTQQSFVPVQMRDFSINLSHVISSARLLKIEFTGVSGWISHSTRQLTEFNDKLRQTSTIMRGIQAGVPFGGEEPKRTPSAKPVVTPPQAPSPVPTPPKPPQPSSPQPAPPQVPVPVPEEEKPRRRRRGRKDEVDKGAGAVDQQTREVGQFGNLPWVLRSLPFALRWMGMMAVLGTGAEIIHGLGKAALGVYRSDLKDVLNTLAGTGMTREEIYRVEVKAREVARDFLPGGTAKEVMGTTAEIASAFPPTSPYIRNLPNKELAPVEMAKYANYFGALAKLPPEQAGALLAQITNAQLAYMQPGEVEAYRTGAKSVVDLYKINAARLAKAVEQTSIWGPQIQQSFQYALPGALSEGWNMESLLAFTSVLRSAGLPASKVGRTFRAFFTKGADWLSYLMFAGGERGVAEKFRLLEEGQRKKVAHWWKPVALEIIKKDPWQAIQMMAQLTERAKANLFDLSDVIDSDMIQIMQSILNPEIIRNAKDIYKIIMGSTPQQLEQQARTNEQDVMYNAESLSRSWSELMSELSLTIGDMNGVRGTIYILNKTMRDVAATLRAAREKKIVPRGFGWGELAEMTTEAFAPKFSERLRKGFPFGGWNAPTEELLIPSHSDLLTAHGEKTPAFIFEKSYVPPTNISEGKPEKSSELPYIPPQTRTSFEQWQFPNIYVNPNKYEGYPQLEALKAVPENLTKGASRLFNDIESELPITAKAIRDLLGTQQQEATASPLGLPKIEEPKPTPPAQEEKQPMQIQCPIFGSDLKLHTDVHIGERTFFSLYQHFLTNNANNAAQGYGPRFESSP